MRKLESDGLNGSRIVYVNRYHFGFNRHFGKLPRLPGHGLNLGFDAGQNRVHPGLAHFPLFDDLGDAVARNGQITHQLIFKLLQNLQHVGVSICPEHFSFPARLLVVTSHGFLKLSFESVENHPRPCEIGGELIRVTLGNAWNLLLGFRKPDASAGARNSQPGPIGRPTTTNVRRTKKTGSYAGFFWGQVLQGS